VPPRRTVADRSFSDVRFENEGGLGVADAGFEG
jgi:hypothetical protein